MDAPRGSVREADIVASWGAALRSRTAGAQDESRCGAIHKQRPYRVCLESRDGARAGLRLAPAILNAEARTSVRNIALGRQDQRAHRACRAIQRAAQARPSGPWPVSMLLVISNLWRSMTATALSPARAT